MTEATKSPTQTTAPTLIERLRWNAENSATASRFNMGMDQVAAADEIERLRRLLIVAVRADPTPNEWFEVLEACKQ